MWLRPPLLNISSQNQDAESARNPCRSLSFWKAECLSELMRVGCSHQPLQRPPLGCHPDPSPSEQQLEYSAKSHQENKCWVFVLFCFNDSRMIFRETHRHATRAMPAQNSAVPTPHQPPSQSSKPSPLPGMTVAPKKALGWPSPATRMTAPCPSPWPT